MENINLPGLPLLSQIPVINSLLPGSPRNSPEVRKKDPSPTTTPTSTSAGAKNVSKDFTTEFKKKHRKKPSLSIGGAFQAEREGAIFEHFLMIGLEPKNNDFSRSRSDSAPIPHVHSDPDFMAMKVPAEDPIRLSHSSNNLVSESEFKVPELPITTQAKESDIKILYRYPPSDKELPFEVISFCFPKGVETKKLRMSRSQSDLNSLLYGRMDITERASQSFIFLVTHDEDVFYGVCVTNEELLERFPSLMRNHPNYRPWNFTNLAATSRVYCFITRFPFFKVHYSILFNILARERLYTVEESMDTNAVKANANISNDIELMLMGYHRQPVPTAGSSVKFNVPGTDLLDLVFEVPQDDEEMMISDWALPAVFRLFKLTTILQLFTAALLERPIIVVSQNKCALSNIILSIIPLLRPFVWQGPLIPLLPHSLLEYVQAPVPYIVGITKLPEELEKELSHAFILKVESEEVKLPATGLINLPGYEKFENNLRNYHYYLNTCTVKRYHVPYNSTPKQLEYCHKVMIEFRKFHQNVISMVTKF